jgi:23S rRNA (pseudouridine1915-N3)-methyltransferase
MRLRLIAVGTRMPHWVDAAYQDYARRLRRPWALTLTQVAPAHRHQGARAALEAKATEARRILALLSPRDCVVPLDEHAPEPTTLELVQWLEQRRSGGQDLVFVIGGPDGLGEEVLARSQFRWALTRLTLPHALARVLLVEQLYRAASIIERHPYHRA